MKKFKKFPLEIQFFAEDDHDKDDEVNKGDEEEKTISKKKYDKLASELAVLKKELRNKNTDEENARLDAEAKEEKIKELEKEVTKNKVAASLSKSGFDEKEIDEIVEAITENDTDALIVAVASSRKNVVDKLQKEIDTLKLSNVDTPNGGSVGKNGDYKDYKNMTIDEKIALKNSNPEMFKQLRNKK